jgi:hypothetical protein
MPGVQELLMLAAIIVVLSATGLWPVVIRGLRELRGERIEQPSPRSPAKKAKDSDLCYRLLGVSSTASWDEIERAYKGKAKVHHPDLGGDEDAMRTLNEAYNRLKQLRKR